MRANARAVELPCGAAPFMLRRSWRAESARVRSLGYATARPLPTRSGKSRQSVGEDIMLVRFYQESLPGPPLRATSR
eukprot:5016944-Lingulodinium_polyedra.AAC.1